MDHGSWIMGHGHRPMLLSIRIPTGATVAQDQDLRFKPIKWATLDDGLRDEKRHQRDWDGVDTASSVMSNLT
ncbi:hypothetical protein PG997_003975 [Apiospora hydei]|uniref:Uncharacterized protein n=1 Tax=Apiospora hydei TaxID=1337664 RepID=A0ABR1X0Y3_9PEZI